MKLYYTAALLVAGLLGAMPANAADTSSSQLTVGQTPSTDCFNAAQALSGSGNALPGFQRNDALASCTQALSSKMIAKDRIATLVNRGNIEAASGDVTSALADYDAALAMNAKMADIYIDRGSALMRATRYDEARASFDQAVALGGANAYFAYFNRALAEEKAGDINSAYQDYKQAVALAPNYQPARSELARFQVVPRAKTQG
jgi:tetratricopeptide (TPR) repeat protein